MSEQIESNQTEKTATALRSDVKRLVRRPYGNYMTKKRGRWSLATYTIYGWHVSWSNWYQDDKDFDEIGDQVK